MTQACDNLHAYVDGELKPDELTAFELHLVTCEACNGQLPALLGLLAALDGVADKAEGLRSRAASLTVVHEGSEPAAPSLRATAVPIRGGRRQSLLIAAGFTAAAALAASWLIVVRPSQGPTKGSLQSDLAAGRTIEARLSYPGTNSYRPLDATRGARAAETISLDRMVALERAKDWHGLAVASLLAGERDRAVRSFAQAPSTPGADSDRAALELGDGSPAALERGLEAVDRALAVAPNDGTALWNRALVLAGLNLPLAAARQLDHVAALGEPGWADEAKARASALRAQVAQRRARWKQAVDAGTRLLQDGAPVPSELTAVTGYMTIMLYDAVRAAPSRAKVEALLPMAQALDVAYRSDRLSAYVERTAASDFRIRKPLADGYRELILNPAAPGPAVDKFLARLEQAAADDLLLGALVRTGRVAANLEEYRRLAGKSGDPWFAAIAEHETAKAEIARGDRPAAERRLQHALAFARRERLAYRALQLQVELVALHRKLRDLANAHQEAQAAYRDATSAVEELVAMNTLGDLVAINQDRYAQGMARAYLAELLERSESDTATGPSPFDEAHNCAVRQYVHDSLANIALLLFDPDKARAEISRAPSCATDAATQNALTLRSALVWTELFRSSHRAEDGDAARRSLAALRAAPGTSAAQHALLSYIEGDLLIDGDRARGQRSLRQAIAAAGHQADDHGFFVKARAYAFSLLALDAGRASEFAQVISLLAEALEVRKPDRCALAIAVQGRQSAVAFADALGETGGAFDQGAHDLDVSTLVPPAIVARLRNCERVVVMARAPILGRGRLLPPELAWSYLLKGKAAAASPPAAAAGRRLVVANPEVPSDLKFPPLGIYPDEPDAPGVLMLRGSDATPTRVLMAMRDASVIEFHTHGFIANDVSEASYLLLSPELDRRYAMTAGDVARVKLAASPLVILGACHAAASSRSLEGGMGLAAAFLSSGARGVIASPEAVRDLGAQAIFAAIRERVLKGADPAVAVRDERLRRLAMPNDDGWVSGIVVFE